MCLSVRVRVYVCVSSFRAGCVVTMDTRWIAFARVCLSVFELAHNASVVFACTWPHKFIVFIRVISIHACTCVFVCVYVCFRDE